MIKDKDKTKEHLICELEGMRQRVVKANEALIKYKKNS